MRFLRRALLLSFTFFMVQSVHASGKTGKSTKPSKPSSSKTTVSSFFAKLGSEGDDNYVRPYLAPFLSLTANAPTKAYILDNLDKNARRKPEKICNLVMSPSPDGSLVPSSAVFIDGYIDDTTTFAYYYKVGLDGKLQAAIKTTGKREEGKPVRGSGVKEDLDVNSPEVRSRFQKELDYWLSGKFRKHWKPKGASGRLLRSTTRSWATSIASLKTGRPSRARNSQPG